MIKKKFKDAITNFLARGLSLLLIASATVILLCAGNASAQANPILTANAPAGSNTLTVNSPDGMSSGDFAVIHQSQGATAGTYEFIGVKSASGSTLTLTEPLTNSFYASGGHAQVVEIRKYTDLTLSGPLTGPAWDGSRGGIIALYSQGTLTIPSGTGIHMDGKGFRGAGSYCGLGYNGGTQGEGYYGSGGTSCASNSGGGGGGDGVTNSGGQLIPGCGWTVVAAGGGGGGHASSGGQGASGCGAGCGGSGGAGGAPYGNANLLNLGGGGGGGGGNQGWISSCGATGGPGGGIVIVIADTIKGSGIISANGQTGYSNGGGGGGGAGGSVLIISPSAAAAPIQVNGGSGGGRNPGGAGGSGRYALDTTTLTPGKITSVSITPSLGGTEMDPYDTAQCKATVTSTGSTPPVSYQFVRIQANGNRILSNAGPGGTFDCTNICKPGERLGCIAYLSTTPPSQPTLFTKSMESATIPVVESCLTKSLFSTRKSGNRIHGLACTRRNLLSPTSPFVMKECMGNDQAIGTKDLANLGENILPGATFTAEFQPSDPPRPAISANRIITIPGGSITVEFQPSWNGNDGLSYRYFTYTVDAKNAMTLEKGTDNAIHCRYIAGGTTTDISIPVAAWTRGSAHRAFMAWNTTTKTLSCRVDDVPIQQATLTRTMTYSAPTPGTIVLGGGNAGSIPAKSLFNITISSLPYHLVTYCARDATWNPDLDPKDRPTCEQAKLYWTGSKCCGEYNDRPEFYADPLDTLGQPANTQTSGSCWNSTYQNNGKLITGSNEKILTAAGQVLGCGLEPNDPILSVTDQFSKSPIVQTAPECTLAHDIGGVSTANLFCSPKLKKWKLTTSSFPLAISASPVDRTDQECCERGISCWDGTTCVSDQTNQPKLTTTPPISSMSTTPRYRCIRGSWTPAVISHSPDRSERGFCPDPSDCLLTPRGSPMTNYQPFGPQPETFENLPDRSTSFGWATTTKPQTTVMIRSGTGKGGNAIELKDDNSATGSDALASISKPLSSISKGSFEFDVRPSTTTGRLTIALSSIKGDFITIHLDKNGKLTYRSPLTLKDEEFPSTLAYQNGQWHHLNLSWYGTTFDLIVNAKKLTASPLPYSQPANTGDATRFTISTGQDTTTGFVGTYSIDNVVHSCLDPSCEDEVPACLLDGQYFYDHLCKRGTWTSRTKALALELVDLGETISSNDYSIFCGDYTEVLNFLDYDPATLGSGSIKGFLEKSCTFQGENVPCVNNFCAMRFSGNNVAFATTLNAPIDDPEQGFLKALGLKPTSCAAAAIDDGAFHDCTSTSWFDSILEYFKNFFGTTQTNCGATSGTACTNTISYNHALQAVISRPPLTTTPTGAFVSSYPLPRTSPILINNREKNIQFPMQSLQAYADQVQLDEMKDPLSNVSLFKDIFILKSPGRNYFGFMERDTFFGQFSDIVGLAYDGIAVKDQVNGKEACDVILEKIDPAQLQKFSCSFDSQNSRLRLIAKSKTLASGAPDMPLRTFWRDMTAKLR